MDRNLLQEYADFAVKVGVNVQKGQTLIVQAPVEGADFARLCAAAGYEAGAARVLVRYKDEKLARLDMEKAEESELCDNKPWLLRSYLDYAEAPGGVCILHVVAEDPELYKGLDAGKVNRVALARQAALRPWQAYTHSNRVQWCIVAIPSPAWARKVFPDLPQEEAIETLWQRIFTACRVQPGRSAVDAWREHVDATAARRDKLNELGLVRVRMTTPEGTDLTVGLADDAVWAGANSTTPAGATFIANIPTEEVFTAPHRDKVDGVVKGTKPFAYNGQLVEDFTVWFENGKVVRCAARAGEEQLKEMLASDEGASHIGELALVPASSPINQAGVLFYNTLFDENAACHIAFGEGYPENIRGGESMEKPALAAKGLNLSDIHEDVMVGSATMTVTGWTADGREVPIFENGEWVL